MDNILEIFKNLSNLSNKDTTHNSPPIPKEVKDQYPYGEFPIKYTKTGQETIRKQSENRFSYNESQPENKSNGIDLNNFSLLFPLIQVLSGEKKQPKDLMQIFGKLLFKNNPEMEKLFKLFPKIKHQEIKSNSEFPETNKIQINSLKRID